MATAVNAHAFDDSVVIPVLNRQIGLALDESPLPGGRYFSAPDIDLSPYTKIIVLMSAGKDSFACLLHLLDLGVDKSRIELWHHLVDGVDSDLMDWAFMDSYNKAVADAFGIPLYFSWIDGGIEAELMKYEDYSRPHMVETPDGLMTLERDTRRAKPNTRRRFPQQSANLAQRWCSSIAKIDPGRRALNNQSRFNDANILVVSGERRLESANRANYFQFAPHECDRRNGRKSRLVDKWLPVLEWSEEQVWDKLRQWGVLAPVPYRLGWSRNSCAMCVFNSPRIWATVERYFPERAYRIAQLEGMFGSTISRNKIDVLQQASTAKPFEIEDMEALEQATRKEYTLPVFLPQGETWKLPAGAFGKEGCGA